MHQSCSQHGNSLIPRPSSRPFRKQKAQTGFPSNIYCHMGYDLCIKKYHNRILHSGLELSNGLDCYGSQKLRQLRVRTYSTSSLAQTTITHVICNLIQALKSENNLVPCGKSHSKHQTTHVRGSWHETSIHTLFYNVDTCRPGHTHALPGLFRIMHTLSPLNI